MENMESLGDLPPISCGFVEELQLSVSHGTLWKTLYITYTEEVAGSSPVPPTLKGAALLGQPPRCNLKVLSFPRFALDRRIRKAFPWEWNSEQVSGQIYLSDANLIRIRICTS